MINHFASLDPPTRHRRAVLYSVAALVLVIVGLTPNVGVLLAQGLLSDVRPWRVLPLIPVFLVLSYCLSRLDQWLQKIDRPLERWDVPDRIVYTGIAALVILTPLGILALLIYVENVPALIRLVRSVMFAGLICAIEGPIFAVPLLLWWMARQWLRLFRSDSGKSSASTGESAASVGR